MALSAQAWIRVVSTTTPTRRLFLAKMVASARKLDAGTVTRTPITERPPCYPFTGYPPGHRSLNIHPKPFTGHPPGHRSLNTLDTLPEPISEFPGHLPKPFTGHPPGHRSLNIHPNTVYWTPTRTPISEHPPETVYWTPTRTPISKHPGHHPKPFTGHPPGHRSLNTRPKPFTGHPPGHRSLNTRPKPFTGHPPGHRSLNTLDTARNRLLDTHPDTDH